jgi:putative holliday junction resolvase
VSMTENMTNAPIYTIAEFLNRLPPSGRLMALDVGTVTIGIALSDASRMIASPDLTITRRTWTQDVAEIEKIMAKEPITGAVIGYPLNMDGSAGPRAQATRAFARNFHAKFAIPILLWDERLSTAAVTRMMIDEADINRARRDELVDKLAASYILQGVLDGLGHANHTNSDDA